jgi:hypothetical protein
MDADHVVSASTAGFREGMESGLLPGDDIPRERCAKAARRFEPSEFLAWTFAFKMGTKHREMMGGLKISVGP